MQINTKNEIALKNHNLEVDPENVAIYETNPECRRIFCL